MVLQYSNQETSVTIGESVRDEDGKLFSISHHLSQVSYSTGHFFAPFPFESKQLTALSHSLHTPNHRPRRHQRRPHGTPHHNQRLQNRIRAAYHRRNPQLPLRPPRQERQIAGTYNCETHGEHAADGRLQPCHNHGPTRKPDPGLLQRAGG